MSEQSSEEESVDMNIVRKYMSASVTRFLLLCVAAALVVFRRRTVLHSTIFVLNCNETSRERRSFQTGSSTLERRNLNYLSLVGPPFVKDTLEKLRKCGGTRKTRKRERLFPRGMVIVGKWKGSHASSQEDNPLVRDASYCVVMFCLSNDTFVSKQ